MSVRRPARTCVLPVPRNPDAPSLLHSIDSWISGTDNIMPDNAFIEAFNSRLRAECLNAHWFLTLDDAKAKVENWRKYYNEERPHGAIGNKTPITLLNCDGAASPPS